MSYKIHPGPPWVIVCLGANLKLRFCKLHYKGNKIITKFEIKIIRNVNPGSDQAAYLK